MYRPLHPTRKVVDAKLYVEPRWSRTVGVSHRHWEMMDRYALRYCRCLDIVSQQLFSSLAPYCILLSKVKDKIVNIEDSASDVDSALRDAPEKVPSALANGRGNINVCDKKTQQRVENGKRDLFCSFDVR
jgi:hypothetical protein